MNNFAPLAFLDPFDLIASLPRRMGLFQSGEPKILPIRGPRPGADPEDVEAYRTGDLGKWPEMKAIKSQIERVGEQRGGIEFGRIRIELLPPDVRLPWERDESPYAARFNRLAMALRTSPGVVHIAGTEAMHLPLGVVTWVNQRAWRSTVNLGEWSCIHLVVDTRSKGGP